MDMALSRSLQAIPSPCTEGAGHQPKLTSPLLKEGLLPAQPTVLQHLVWLRETSSNLGTSIVAKLGGFTNHLLVNCSTFSEMYLNTVMSETLRCILKKTSRVLHHSRRTLQFRGYHTVTCRNSVQLPAPDPSHQLSCPAAACPPPRPASRVEDLPRQKQLSPSCRSLWSWTPPQASTSYISSCEKYCSNHSRTDIRFNKS